MYCFYAVDSQFNKDIEEPLVNFRSKFEGQQIKGKAFDEGTIKTVQSVIVQPSGDFDIIINVETSDKTLKLALNTALKIEAIILTADQLSVLGEFIDTIQPFFEALLTRCQEAEQIRLAKKEEEEAKIAAEKAALAAEEKQNAYIRHTLATFTALKESQLQQTADFYEAVKWLAFNTKSIVARVPSFATNWFINTFGADTEFKEINFSQKTSGGFPMLWGKSFTLRLKTEEGLPRYLSDKVKNKSISDTTFIYHLVKDFDFTFGTKIDSARILEHLPKELV